MIDERKGDKWLGVVSVYHKAKQLKGKEYGNENEQRMHLLFTIVSPDRHRVHSLRVVRN